VRVVAGAIRAAAVVRAVRPVFLFGVVNGSAVCRFYPNTPTAPVLIAGVPLDLAYQPL
jgi:hypothetical protein